MAYKIQINDEIRDATANEAAQIEAAHAEARAQFEADEAKAAIKKAVLLKLELSDEEVAALFG